jgi:hypothetical protein
MQPARRTLLSLPVFFLLGACAACGGKTEPPWGTANACKADATKDLSPFVGTWACKDTVTGCESFSTPPCFPAETKTDFVTFEADMDGGTLSMISTSVGCLGPVSGPYGCTEEYCVTSGSSAVMDIQAANGTAAAGIFEVSGDSASFRRTEVIRSKVTSTWIGTCTRAPDAGVLGPVDSGLR